MSSTDPIVVRVAGLPPAKGGSGILSPAHPHHDRVAALLRATGLALPVGFVPFREAVEMRLTLFSPTQVPRGDPTNFLGGVADVLQRKEFELPDGLSAIVVYEDDLQIRRVEFRKFYGPTHSYEVTIRGLGGPDIASPRALGFTGRAFVVELADVDEIALAFTNDILGAASRSSVPSDAPALLGWINLQCPIAAEIFAELTVRAANPAIGAAFLDDARRLAAALSRIFHGTTEPPDAEVLSTLYRRVCAFTTLDLTTATDLDVIRFRYDGGDLYSSLSPIIWSAIRLVSPSLRKYISVCADDRCARLFLDRTKNKSKVWCSGACANRAKQRTFRARHPRVSDEAVGYDVS